MQCEPLQIRGSLPKSVDSAQPMMHQSSDYLLSPPTDNLGGYFIIYGYTPARIDLVTGLVTSSLTTPLPPGAQMVYVPPSKTCNDDQTIGAIAAGLKQMAQVSHSPLLQNEQENDEIIEHDLSILEGLPEDVVWAIIDYVPESVRHLKMSSRKLRGVVERYASQASRMRLHDTLFISAPIGSYEREKIYSLEITEDDFAENLSLLAICMGRLPDSSPSRRAIGDVTIGQLCLRDDRPDYVFKIIEGLDFKKLDISFYTLTDYKANILRKIIVEHRVECLSLNFQEVICDQKVLLEFSPLVHTMSLSQEWFAHTDDIDDYFFGKQDFDWAPIILAMLKKETKLDKLCIQNAMSADFVSNGCYDTLKNHLPLIGKKIWFRLRCTTPANPRSTLICEHLVEEERGYLTVKHVSRKDDTIRM